MFIYNHWIYSINKCLKFGLNQALPDGKTFELKRSTDLFIVPGTYHPILERPRRWCIQARSQSY